MQETRGRTTFFSLPLELRDAVYAHVLDGIASAIAKDASRKHTNGYWSRPQHIEQLENEFYTAHLYFREHILFCAHEGLFLAHPLIAAELCEGLEERGLHTTIALSLQRQTKRPRQLMGIWTGLNLPTHIHRTISKVHFQIPSVTDVGFLECIPA